MTDEHKETLKFYTINDYLLINGILWGEDEKTIDMLIQIINEDGRGVVKEARELGFDVRWNCTTEEGERIYQVYQKRFPVIDSDAVKKQIIERAQNDIANMMACMEPLTADLCLYRNIKSKFIGKLAEGQKDKSLIIWVFPRAVYRLTLRRMPLTDPADVLCLLSWYRLVHQLYALI